MINIDQFILKPEYFDHQSQLHGIDHTYRVMTLVLLLGKRLGLERECKLAFMAAFIHDMARRHDGFCNRHGKRAVKYKLPQFAEFFKSQGIQEEDLKEIAFAVHFHCKYIQPSSKHPYFNTLALLKDADALDRIRISPDDLNPRFLRFDESSEFIGIAENLYYKSQLIEEKSLPQFLNIVGYE
jgi:hypothetical protein